MFTHDQCTHKPYNNTSSLGTQLPLVNRVCDGPDSLIGQQPLAGPTGSESTLGCSLKLATASLASLLINRTLNRLYRLTSYFTLLFIYRVHVKADLVANLQWHKFSSYLGSALDQASPDNQSLATVQYLLSSFWAGPIDHTRVNYKSEVKKSKSLYVSAIPSPQPIYEYPLKIHRLF